MPKLVSNIVLVTAIAGINRFGRNEFTCAAYPKKLVHPDDCLPQRLRRLSTADKNPAANASRRDSVEMFVIFMPVFLWLQIFIQAQR